ncbi:hypothetical protein [Halolamina rubra]|uniref:hypothetical protein n=1 Tax=Halolamina rubra TaxID=1380430 RepID=UPI0006794991|nr:hypothetical protein [Halolamina rubra]
MTALGAGESVDMETRVDGGPTITRDTLVDDAYAVSGAGGELSRDEIRRLAELAGLEVDDA